jgi:hypothetical protein
MQGGPWSGSVPGELVGALLLAAVLPLPLVLDPPEPLGRALLHLPQPGRRRRLGLPRRALLLAAAVARGLGSSPLSHWSAHDVPNELLRCMMSVSRSAERAIERGAGWKSPEMRQRLSAPGTKQETGRWICLLNLVVSGRGSAFIAGVTIAPGTPNTSWSMRDAF